MGIHPYEYSDDRLCRTIPVCEVCRRFFSCIFTSQYIGSMRLLYKIFRWMVGLFFVTSVAAVLVYKWCPVPFTPLMIIRCAQQVKAGEAPRLKHRWVPLSEMSRYMPVAVIASEDQRFLYHNGFDAEAINDALKERAQGKRRRGASTISQQTAKNVFLWPESSWIRKGFEVYFTFLIESLWSKQRIMEVYLNSIEMGDGIYGVEAVAQQHFSCPASELTRSECALIAATLPNPLRYSSLRPGPYMRKRQSWIKKQMIHVPLLEAEEK